MSLCSRNSRNIPFPIVFTSPDCHLNPIENDVEKQMFPPCNVEWSQAEGSRLWCTKKSGGITRDWVGVPR